MRDPGGAGWGSREGRALREGGSESPESGGGGQWAGLRWGGAPAWPLGDRDTGKEQLWGKPHVWFCGNLTYYGRKNIKEPIIFLVDYMLKFKCFGHVELNKIYY